MTNSGVSEIDWDNLLDNFDFSPNGFSPTDSGCLLSIDDVEKYDDDHDLNHHQQNNVSTDEFFSELLMKSPPDSGKDDEKEEDNNAAVVVVVDDDDNTADDHDPAAKKRKRQMRNRDAAVRSRERKKSYVRDLEMKSKYYEAECKRLGILFQCCLAENQALRLSLHNTKAFDASMTKQESAVLHLDYHKKPISCFMCDTCGYFIMPIMKKHFKQFGKVVRIPAVGFPAWVPGHHMPAYPADPPPVNSGSGSSQKRVKRKEGKTSSKKGRK